MSRSITCILHSRSLCRQVGHAIGIVPIVVGSITLAGPYSPGKGGSLEVGFVDAGIPGFLGPAGEGVTATATNGNYLNPIFKGWATGVASYLPSDVLGPYDQNGIGRPPAFGADFGNPNSALGQVSGDNFAIVSLGDLHMPERAANVAPGSLTLTFDHPIYNGPGADFAAFENGFVSKYSTGNGSVAGQMFAEFGFVEVSTDGTNFARFPSQYLNYPDASFDGQENSRVRLNGADKPLVGTAYLTQDVSNVYNLVGKHANAYSASFGTPFNLDDLVDHPLVLGGIVDLDAINYVKIVDIAGDGRQLDSMDRPIFDAWVTWGSGGLDFEALGVINQSVITPEPTLLAGLLGLGTVVTRRRRN